MRVLLWSPNYAPEPTGIGPLATELVDWLTRDSSNHVDVVTPMPNYPERRIHDAYRGALWRTESYHGARVHRSWLLARRESGLADKALYELTSSTLAFPNALRLARASDVLVCVVPTLLAAAYAALIARALRKPLVLWVQDLVLLAAASVVRSAEQVPLRLARQLERFASITADQVIVCSGGFNDYLIDLGVDPARISVIRNWVDLDWIKRTEEPAADRPRFLYAGNIGHTQGLETVLDAARLVGDLLTVEIVGDGNASHRIRGDAGGLKNVTVRPPVETEEYPALLASSAVQLVVQRRVSAGANLPSKIGSALASGRPIIASISPDTDAAKMLRESGAAVIVDPESPQDLAVAMKQLAGDAQRRRELGVLGRKYAERCLSSSAALEQFEEVLHGAAERCR